MNLAMTGDKIVSAGDLEPVYLDRGVFFGDGVYEVVRSYEGKIFALEEHLQRFSRSLKEIDIRGVNIEKIRSRIQKAFSSASTANAKIYFHITRGSAPREHTYDDSLEPNFFLTISELPDSSEIKSNGIAVSTHPDLRWKRCDIKSLNLLPNILARTEASRKGSKEAILVDESGFITEGAGSAFFAIKADTLQTAPLSANILPSITRKYVIKAANNIRMEVLEKSLAPREAEIADELFIGVTTNDIVPVIKFDEQIINNGKPGRYAAEIMREFKSFTR